MYEDMSREQQSVKETLAPETVIAYIDEKIEGQRRALRQFGQPIQEGKLGTLTIDPGKEPERAAEMLEEQRLSRRASVTEEIKRLEATKKAIAKGEYRGVAAELQGDCQSERQNLEGQRQDLQGKLEGDEKFFELQEQINRGHKILRQLTDPQDQSWVQGVIEQLETQQGTTERKRSVVRMRQTQAKIARLEALQQFVSNQVTKAR